MATPFGSELQKTYMVRTTFWGFPSLSCIIKSSTFVVGQTAFLRNILLDLLYYQAKIDYSKSIHDSYDVAISHSLNSLFHVCVRACTYFINLQGFPLEVPDLGAHHLDFISAD